MRLFAYMDILDCRECEYANYCAGGWRDRKDALLARLAAEGYK